MTLYVRVVHSLFSMYSVAKLNRRRTTATHQASVMVIKLLINSNLVYFGQQSITGFIPLKESFSNESKVRRNTKCFLPH